MSTDGTVDAAVVLAQGVESLTPVLRRHGFRVSAPMRGKGSGGPFASASFVREGRVLNLWLRHASLSARYEMDGKELDHAAYMRALLGPAGGNAFPAYANDPVAAFAALKTDLLNHAGDFLSGPGDEYRRCWDKTKADESRSGFMRLGDAASELDRS